MNLDVNRGLNPFEALGNVSQSPVGDNLASDLLVRRHANQNDATMAVEEGAERLRGAGQLAGALLELYGVGFAAADEGFYFHDCHWALALPAVNRILGRRGRGCA